MRWTRQRIIGVVLLLGWAAYLTVVTASNLSELAWSFGWVDWVFRSGNLGFIAKATSIYTSSEAVNQVLLAGAILWELAAAVLCWRAVVAWTQERRGFVWAGQLALLVPTALWIAFAVGTEITVAYDRGINESTYWVLAAASLGTLLVVSLVAASEKPGIDAPAR